MARIKVYGTVASSAVANTDKETVISIGVDPNLWMFEAKKFTISMTNWSDRAASNTLFISFCDSSLGNLASPARVHISDRECVYQWGWQLDKFEAVGHWSFMDEWGDNDGSTVLGTIRRTFDQGEALFDNQNGNIYIHTFQVAADNFTFNICIEGDLKRRSIIKSMIE